MFKKDIIDLTKQSKQPMTQASSNNTQQAAHERWVHLEYLRQQQRCNDINSYVPSSKYKTAPLNWRGKKSGEWIFEMVNVEHSSLSDKNELCGCKADIGIVNAYDNSSQCISSSKSEDSEGPEPDKYHIAPLNRYVSNGKQQLPACKTLIAEAKSVERKRKRQR